MRTVDQRLREGFAVLLEAHRWAAIPRTREGLVACLVAFLRWTPRA